MLNLINKSPYDRKVYNSLITSNVIPVDKVDDIFQEFYPIVLNIYDKEVDTSKYVEMLKGIYLRKLSKNEVLKIVGISESDPILDDSITNRNGLLKQYRDKRRVRFAERIKVKMLKRTSKN